MLQVDGSQGEGGGQILRTSLSLSALTGRSFRLNNIRANRPKAGLRPQHLTAVQAAAAVCDAELVGASLNSTSLEFHPRTAPASGSYFFDVAEAAAGGSAGAVSLVFQTVLWPLLFAEGPSELTLSGGTHVPFSPAYHYLAHVALPAFVRLGAHFKTELHAWGWYPAGGGVMRATIAPIDRLEAKTFERPTNVVVDGVAAVTNLPAHIPQRMAGRARNLLAEAELQPRVQALRETGRAPGAGLVLWMPGAGSTSLGKRGLAAERVAETAVAEILEFVQSGATVDQYLADQLLLPLALAEGLSQFSTHRLTQHVVTNMQLLHRWLGVDIELTGALDELSTLRIRGIGFKRAKTVT